MLGYLSSSTEWLQEHAVRLLLRKNGGHFFEDPADLDQIKVQLRQHELQQCMKWSARLTNTKISCATLNEHLVRLHALTIGAREHPIMPYRNLNHPGFRSSSRGDLCRTHSAWRQSRPS